VRFINFEKGRKILTLLTFGCLVITISTEWLLCLQFAGSLIVGAFLIRKWNEPFGYSRMSPAYTQAWSTSHIGLVCWLTVDAYVANDSQCAH